MPFDLPRFYPILDSGLAVRHGIDLVQAAAEILEGGARILQFRHKSFFSREIFAAMERMAALCRDAGIPFVVNDRADLAAILGAALHLGQDDLPPATARKITGPRAVIGFSTHNEAQLREAGEEGTADYLALGPIFGTATKENPDPTVGLSELKRLRPLVNQPLVAIGGITLENASATLAAGADSVSVIGDLFVNPSALRARTREWVAATSL